MTATLERCEGTLSWEHSCPWIASTENRSFVGWISFLTLPASLTPAHCFIIGFVAAPPSEMESARELVAGL